MLLWLRWSTSVVRPGQLGGQGGCEGGVVKLEGWSWKLSGRHLAVCLVFQDSGIGSGFRDSLKNRKTIGKNVIHDFWGALIWTGYGQPSGVWCNLYTFGLDYAHKGIVFDYLILNTSLLFYIPETVSSTSPRISQNIFFSNDILFRDQVWFMLFLRPCCQPAPEFWIIIVKF